MRVSLNHVIILKRGSNGSSQSDSEMMMTLTFTEIRLVVRPDLCEDKLEADHNFNSSPILIGQIVTH